MNAGSSAKGSAAWCSTLPLALRRAGPRTYVHASGQGCRPGDSRAPWPSRAPTRSDRAAVRRSQALPAKRPGRIAALGVDLLFKNLQHQAGVNRGD